MRKFIVSGFSDEISPSIDEQILSFRKLGLTHLVLRFVDNENIADLTLSKAHEVKRKLDESGLAVSSLGSPIGKADICRPQEEEMNRLMHVLEIAAVLGSKYIRVFSFFIPKGADFKNYSAQVKERLGAMVTAAHPYGITLLHENEKDIFGDVDTRCAEILRDLSPYGLRAAFDPANFVQCNIDPLSAYKLLKPYIAYMHIKDALFSDHSVVPAGKGDGKIPDILYDLAHNSGDSDMFLSLEPHLGSFAGLASLERDSAVLSKPEGGFPAYELALKSLKEILSRL